MLSMKARCRRRCGAINLQQGSKEMNYKRFLLVTGAAAVLAGGRVVNLRLALIGLVGLAGSGTVVHAEVLGSGALFSSGQNNAVCTVTNVSPSPSGVSNVRI